MNYKSKFDGDLKRYRVVLIFGCVTIFSGCPLTRPNNSNMMDEPLPPPSFVTDGYRNTPVYMDVKIKYAFVPADPNAAPVLLNEYYKHILNSLDTLGKSDNNVFLYDSLCPKEVPAKLSCSFEIYTDGGPPPYTTWSLEAYLSKYYRMTTSTASADYGVHEFRTKGYNNINDAIDDITSQIYAWIHNGWSPTKRED